MPDPGPLVYLFEAIQNIGLCGFGHNGPVPTEWQSIVHWPRIRRFLECEVEDMHRLSVEYVAVLKNPKTEQPWDPEV